jgi:hypothetical protein
MKKNIYILKKSFYKKLFIIIFIFTLCNDLFTKENESLVNIQNQTIINNDNKNLIINLDELDSLEQSQIHTQLYELISKFQDFSKLINFGLPVVYKELLKHYGQTTLSKTLKGEKNKIGSAKKTQFNAEEMKSIIHDLVISLSLSPNQYKESFYRALEEFNMFNGQKQHLNTILTNIAGRYGQECVIMILWALYITPYFKKILMINDDTRFLYYQTLNVPFRKSYVIKSWGNVNYDKTILQMFKNDSSDCKSSALNESLGIFLSPLQGKNIIQRRLLFMQLLKQFPEEYKNIQAIVKKIRELKNKTETIFTGYSPEGEAQFQCDINVRELEHTLSTFVPYIDFTETGLNTIIGKNGIGGYKAPLWAYALWSTFKQYNSTFMHLLTNYYNKYTGRRDPENIEAEVKSKFIVTGAQDSKQSKVGDWVAHSLPAFYLATGWRTKYSDALLTHDSNNQKSLLLKNETEKKFNINIKNDQSVYEGLTENLKNIDNQIGSLSNEVGKENFRNQIEKEMKYYQNSVNFNKQQVIDIQAQSEYRDMLFTKYELESLVNDKHHTKIGDVWRYSGAVADNYYNLSKNEKVQKYFKNNNFEKPVNFLSNLGVTSIQVLYTLGIVGKRSFLTGVQLYQYKQMVNSYWEMVKTWWILIKYFNNLKSISIQTKKLSQAIKNLYKKANVNYAYALPEIIAADITYLSNEDKKFFHKIEHFGLNAPGKSSIIRKAMLAPYAVAATLAPGILADFYFKEVKDHPTLRIIDNFIGSVELALAKNKIIDSSTQEKPFTYVSISSNNSESVFSIKDVWNPGIKNSTHNTINFSGTKQNACFVGPTGSGKSVILASILNVLYSSNMGIAPAASCIYPYYTIVLDHLKPDYEIGKDGLSKHLAERKSLQEIIEVQRNIRRMCPSACMLAIFDEIYSGTNPSDAVVLAKRDLGNLMSDKNTNIIITTHFPDLVKIVDIPENKMALYYLMVQYDGLENFRNLFTITEDSTYGWWITNENLRSKYNMSLDKKGYDARKQIIPGME